MAPRCSPWWPARARQKPSETSRLICLPSLLREA
jgi:hypothetical protein